MKKKNDFGMWLFSDGVSKALNWFAVVLAGIWIIAHLIKAIF